MLLVSGICTAVVVVIRRQSTIYNKLKRNGLFINCLQWHKSEMGWGENQRNSSTSTWRSRSLYEVSVQTNTPREIIIWYGEGEKSRLQNVTILLCWPTPYAYHQSTPEWGNASFGVKLTTNNTHLANGTVTVSSSSASRPCFPRHTFSTYQVGLKFATLYCLVVLFHCVSNIWVKIMEIDLARILLCSIIQPFSHTTLMFHHSSGQWIRRKQKIAINTFFVEFPPNKEAYVERELSICVCCCQCWGCIGLLSSTASKISEPVVCLPI